MAFLKEQIPKELKNSFDPEVFYDRRKGTPIEAYEWAIDRERNIFVIRTEGGGPQGADKYILSLQGQIIKFQGDSFTDYSDKENGWDVYWGLFNIEIPPAFEEQRNTILVLIEEAMMVLGNPNSPPDIVRVKAVHIKFLSAAPYLEKDNRPFNPYK